MHRTLFSASLALLLPLVAMAQSSPQPAPTPAVAVANTAEAPKPAPVLQPFVANYVVYKAGKPLGEATMQLVRQQPPRWRVDLVMRGTRGLFGLAGINAEQSTVFDLIGETYRPLTQATVNKSIFTRKQTIGIYDWRSDAARWQGETKEHRRGPIALQPGDMTGLLINLAVIRDAEPGDTLQYRFVDDGRTRTHTYVVADRLESITVGDLSYKAMKATRAKDDNEETVIWVARNVPTPIRILQRENGEDTYDLRLVEYRGVD
ncbi:MAG: DUF3108 domain-containing protein [Lysobacter sp.]